MPPSLMAEIEVAGGPAVSDPWRIGPEGSPGGCVPDEPPTGLRRQRITTSPPSNQPDGAFTTRSTPATRHGLRPQCAPTLSAPSAGLPPQGGQHAGHRGDTLVSAARTELSSAFAPMHMQLQASPACDRLSDIPGVHALATMIGEGHPPESPAWSTASSSLSGVEYRAIPTWRRMLGDPR